MTIYQIWIFGIATFSLMHLSVSALQCWKCIAHDCELDPEGNYKASKMKCNDGDKCMKVRYRMFDNITHYDSVIRTCTSKSCNKASNDDFAKCLATPKLYMISGCVYKSCCDDRDLCNSGNMSEEICIFNLTICMLTFIVLQFQMYA